MKSEDLRLDELVRFGEGLVDLHGRRLVIHDAASLGSFRRDLIEMVGWEDARRILTRKGYFWGQADAAAMKRLFHWDSVEEWIKAGTKLTQVWGIGRVEPLSFGLDAAMKSFSMEFICHDSLEVEECMAELGTSDRPCCWVLMGYASGYASYCLGKSVYFVEHECRAAGDDRCMAMGMDIDSWGPKIADELSYFHASDIQGKIQALNNELHRKELELERRLRALQQSTQELEGTGRSTIASVEVRSREFQAIVDLAERVAKFDSSVLITGETGVGKEIVARHIHSHSHRSNAPFVAINCGALPDTLLESALFGHKAGSFTGATRDQPGLFEEAAKGTIFLDEIGDTTPAMQLKLLRVLQEHEFMRVGETRTHKVDVRVLSATNIDLRQAVVDGDFREDLYYRLAVVDILVPPLRCRKDDILALARHFIKKCAVRLGLPELRLDATSLDLLHDYPWPGNVRELENAIEHAAVFCEDGVILPQHFPAHILGIRPESGRTREPAQIQNDADLAKHSLVDVEWAHIQRVLSSTGGNRSEAAKILGIGEATLYRRLREFQHEKMS